MFEKKLNLGFLANGMEAKEMVFVGSSCKDMIFVGFCQLLPKK